MDNSETFSHGDIRIVNTGCCHDCGGRCVLKAHVKDGRVIRLESDTGEYPQIRACMRGRAYRQRLYSPDRLQHPLRRVGKKGAGKFERVSWDDALNEVAGKLQHVKETYGNASILLLASGGNQGMLHGPLPVGAMLQEFGGFTRTWGIASYEGAMYASMATYGTIRTGNSREDLLNSKMVILWGWNPAVTIQDPGTSLMLARVKEKGVKIVVVDPRYSDSAATFGQQWIPIRPGTDSAVLIAMAYVILKENLQDQAFIDKHTVGIEKYKDYLFGDEDGIPKTPRWAESISTVPAQVIAELAREYAQSKPAALIAGWAPARAAFGEQYSRAANVLTAMTGNIGVSGGYAAGFMRAYSSREFSHKKVVVRPDQAKPRSTGNPVEDGASPRKYSLHKLYGGTNPNGARIHNAKVFDAILRGKAGGYPADIKLGYVVASNCLNQNPNTRRGKAALEALDFLVVHEQFMTPTARFADIVLPVNTFMERSDIAPPWLGSPYYIYLNKAVDSLYEAKSDLDICRELAPKLGISPMMFAFTEDEILQGIAAGRDDIPDYGVMKRDGVLKIRLDEPMVSFKEQIEDPGQASFPTLSGKIEIYCEHLAEMGDPSVPPVPRYMPHAESHDASLAKQYPLQLITPHDKKRAHSTWYNVPWCSEIEPHVVRINPVDARDRGIRDDDMVDLFNDRGRVRIRARVTERIMPGVLELTQGAWYDPDEEGVDLGGCANVLTRDDASPGGAHPMNSTLVQVEAFSQD
ncbi:MAG: molybdopterin-dependent oxidoreductase [Thermodesulfobacteriota bacterium]